MLILYKLIIFVFMTIFLMDKSYSQLIENNAASFHTSSVANGYIALLRMVTAFASAAGRLGSILYHVRSSITSYQKL